MRTATMSLTSASGLVVILLSVAVVQGQNEWRVTYPSTQICALTGSSVQISSNYSCPAKINGQDTKIKNTFWFTKKFVDLKTQPKFADRVQYDCVNTNCTLTISDLRKTDSAQYKFRIITNQGTWYGSPGVNLSVTAHPDLQVHVRNSAPCPSLTCVHVDLRCQSRCHLPDRSSYIWLKNGREIRRHTSSSYSDTIFYEDTISCAVKGYETFSSPPMFAPTRPSVSVSPSGLIVKGSSVTLTCTSDANPPVTEYTWYKTNQTTDQQLMSGKNQFVFEYIKLSDSGQYYCKVDNTLWVWRSNDIPLDVKALPSVSMSPSGLIVEGSSVTLTCTSDANPPVTKYTWYKEDEDSPKASGPNFTIEHIQSEHSGNYYCEVEDSGGRRKSMLYHLIVVSDSSRSVGVTFAVLLPIILLFALILFKKKRASIKSSEPKVTPDSGEQRPPSQRQSEDQDNVHYVAVNFSQYQEDPIYSNTGPAQHHRYKKEHMFTEYAAVKFSDTRKDQRTELQGTEEDPALLYSTVNKPQRT